MMTLLLSKVLGIFLVIVGLAAVLRSRHFAAVAQAFVQERLTRLVLAITELLAGLFLVVTHNDWSSLPAILVTLLGWMAVIEGAAYLLLPDKILKRLVEQFRSPAWYVGGGLVSIVIGAYLAAFGFGLF
jgi:uncharacterized membrane protein HdeD (DUF308 family)